MSGYPRRSDAIPLSRARSLVIPDDDKFEDLEEANPFSFEEFLKTKNLGLSKEDPASRIYAKEASRHSLVLTTTPQPPKPGRMAWSISSRFSKTQQGPVTSWIRRRTRTPDGVGPTCRPPWSRLTPRGSLPARHPDSTYLFFLSTSAELAGPESLPPWALSDTDSRVTPASPAGSPSAEFSARGEPLGDRHLRTLQISYEAKRAVKAENHVIKLKQEVHLLQAQVSNFQQENEALRCGQGTSLTVVKQNADIALQNLPGVMSGAQASIKQLVFGAETLNLVEILKSIDRISEITDEEDP
ncbi:hypothetical protein P7K49_000650 [Saguinus oedipus]|uniref:Endosome-associated-trafficking regulator 1 n=1 Tax=Saguinus oedipus TaxID=9490 RepID=A0ABQ9WC89_SAGOE|nr:hypothetical protein P7K49_000650 [Saguinus oedipus]